MKARRKTREREREKKETIFATRFALASLCSTAHKRFHKGRARERERERACALALPSIAPPLLRFSYAV